MGKRKCLVVGFCAFFALYNIGPNSSGNQSDDREQAILVPVPVDPPDVVPPDGATNPDPNYCSGNTTFLLFITYDKTSKPDKNQYVHLNYYSVSEKNFYRHLEICIEGIQNETDQ
jgi:hypothetical protein